MTVGDESAGGCIVAVEFNWAAGRGITGPTDPTRRLVRSPAVLTLTTIEVDPHSTRQAYPVRIPDNRRVLQVQNWFLVKGTSVVISSIDHRELHQ